VSSRRGPDLPYNVVAGVTPFNDKWLVASAKMAGSTFAPEPPKAYDAFLEVLSERPSFAIVVVNVPIGFLDVPEMGARTCDRQARALLGRRGTAVHNAPSRAVFDGRVGPDKDGLDAVTRTMLRATAKLRRKCHRTGSESSTKDTRNSVSSSCTRTLH